jgi:phosphate acetyltransferase
MNSIIDSIKKRARSKQGRIILSESYDPRVLRAAAHLLEEQICEVVLIDRHEELQALIDEHEIPLDLDHSKLEVVQLTDTDVVTKAANRLVERRKHKGMTLEEALQIANEPLWLGSLLLGMGKADGAVAGSVATTADVIRSGIYSLGLAQGVKTVSSTFLMAFGDGKTFTYADCGVVPYPDANQLADITISAAHSHAVLTEQESRVAMLSFSTKGSAEHPSVELVRNALTKVKQRDPQLLIDGELQFDAAYVPEIAKRKAPQSEVAGHANVYIFPNLDAGNIAYKITERLANAQATGPILQGLAKPLMDLSRGCSAEDIVIAACVSLLLA